MAPQRRSIVQLLRSELRRGKTVLAISRQYKLPRALLLRLARRENIRYPNRPATTQQRRDAIDAVVRRGLSIRDAAAKVGISRSAVHRIIWRERERIAKPDGNFSAVVVSPYRCPIHGLVTVSPCPACEAQSERDGGTAG